jgi:hypothetical protein
MLLPLHYQEVVVAASIKERNDKRENAEQRNTRVAAHLRKEESKQENAKLDATEYVDYVDLENVDADIEINPNVEVADLENVDAHVVVAEDHEE